jgi:hypothetical protein
MCSGTAVLAADLTIPPTTPNSRASAATTSSVAKKQRRPISAKKENNNNLATKADKMKRSDKSRRRKIATYRLYNDPLFKHGGALTSKGKPATAGSDMGLGTGIGYTALGNPASISPRSVFSEGPSTGYKVDATNSAVAFDCREKSSNASPTRREMTACYVHKLDKSWKTQTYVSRRLSDGSADWGGGLAVGFDY